MNNQQRTKIVVEALKMSKMSIETKELRALTLTNLLLKFPADMRPEIEELLLNMTDAIFAEGVNSGMKSTLYLVKNGMEGKLND